MSIYSEEGSEAGVDEDIQRDLDSLQRALEEEESTAVNEPELQDPLTSIAERPLEGLKLCLQKNIDNQKLFKSLLGKIDEAVELNHTKRDDIAHPLVSKRKRFTYWKFYMYKGAYFKDSKGKACPCSQDVLMPFPDGPRNFYLTEYQWQKSSQDAKLLEGVRMQAIDKKSFPLQVKLQDSSTTLDEIRETRRKIKELSTISDDELFSDLTDIDWSSINYAQFNSQKTVTDCRLRWENHVSPKVYNGPWSKEEEKRLMQLAKQHDSSDWKCIASELRTNRTAYACLKHYKELFNKSSIEKQSWTPELDKLLTEGVRQFGSKNWRAVANHVGGGFSPSQCLHRWFSSTNPVIKKGRWTDEEDELLKEGVRLHGTKWAYVSCLVPSRTSTQCRERWVNVLDTNLNRGKWEKEEDDKLINICKQYEGESIPWAKVAQEMGNRTDAMCSFRWKRLSSMSDVVKQYALRMAGKALTRNAHLSPSDIVEGMLPEPLHKKVEEFEVRLKSFKERRRKPVTTCPSPELAIRSIGGQVINEGATTSRVSPLVTNASRGTSASSGRGHGSGRGKRGGGGRRRSGGRKRTAESALLSIDQLPPEKRSHQSGGGSARNEDEGDHYNDMMRITSNFMQQHIVNLFTQPLPVLSQQQLAGYAPATMSLMGFPVLSRRIGEEALQDQSSSQRQTAGQSQQSLSAAQTQTSSQPQVSSQAQASLQAQTALTALQAQISAQMQSSMQAQSSIQAQQLAQIQTAVQAQILAQTGLSPSTQCMAQPLAVLQAEMLAQYQQLAQRQALAQNQAPQPQISTTIQQSTSAPSSTTVAATAQRQSQVQANHSHRSHTQKRQPSRRITRSQGPPRTQHSNPIISSSTTAVITTVSSTVAPSSLVNSVPSSSASVSSGVQTALRRSSSSERQSPTNPFPKGPQYITVNTSFPTCSTQLLNNVTSSVMSSFIQPHSSLLAPQFRQNRFDSFRSEGQVDPRSYRSTIERRLESECNRANTGLESESITDKEVEIGNHSDFTLESECNPIDERESAQSPPTQFSDHRSVSSPLNSNHPVGAAVSALLSLSDRTNSRSPSRYSTSPLTRLRRSPRLSQSPITNSPVTPANASEDHATTCGSGSDDQVSTSMATAVTTTCSLATTTDLACSLTTHSSVDQTGSERERVGEDEMSVEGEGDNMESESFGLDTETAHSPSPPLLDITEVQVLVVPEALRCSDCLGEESETIKLTHEPTVALLKVDGPSLIATGDKFDDEIPCLAGFPREASVESNNSYSSFRSGSIGHVSLRSTPSRSLSPAISTPDRESSCSSSLVYSPEEYSYDSRILSARLCIAGEPEICGLAHQESVECYERNREDRSGQEEAMNPINEGHVQQKSQGKRRQPPRRAAMSSRQGTTSRGMCSN